MHVIGLSGWTDTALAAELAHGGRFVFFEYCISLIVITFRRPSPIYFLRAGSHGLGPLLRYSLASLLLGWWGVPWGLVYTPLTLITNLSGGRDVTEEVWTWLQDRRRHDRP
jgi:hypothetical protein